MVRIKSIIMYAYTFEMHRSFQKSCSVLTGPRRKIPAYLPTRLTPTDMPLDSNVIDGGLGSHSESRIVEACALSDSTRFRPVQGPCQVS
jgi:hypothetical protein